MAKKITAKPKKHTKRDAIIGIGLLVLVAVIAYGIFYVPYSIQKDKQRFLDAKPYLESIKTRVEDTIGKADSTTYEEGCSRPNLKFTEGPLNCNIQYELSYPNYEAEKASNSANSVAQLFDSEILGIRGAYGEIMSIQYTPGPPFLRQSYSQQLDRLGGLNCSVVYSLYNPSNSSESVNTFSISLLCSGSAKREHFTIHS